MEGQNFFDRSIAKVRNAVSEVSIEQREFIKDFVRMCEDGWKMGWHESNGGNASYRMTEEDLDSSRSQFKEVPGEWTPFGVRAQGLQGEFFVVTRAGCHFRNMADDPSASLGIVEINPTGDSWRSVWGFKDDGRPTSEFVSHFMVHAVRKAVSAGSNRVVYHSHPENVIALLAVLGSDTARVTRVVWKSLIETILVVPEGVGVSTWAVPGSISSAEKTGTLMERFSAVIWPHHGLLSVGNTLDDAFGRTHAIEKAAAIYLKAAAIAGESKNMEMVTNDELRQAAEAFGVTLNEEFIS